MYNQQPYSKRVKTPRHEGNNIFRIPSPLSPSFITTQSLGKLPIQRKKERVSSSPSLNVKSKSQPLSSPLLLPQHISSDAKIKYASNVVSNPLEVYGTPQAITNTNEDHESHSWKNQETNKVARTQIYLPGDRVIFAESPSAPGIPIVYRLDDERRSNPDKLNLDRRKLSVCPILEGEENLRLLNFQHNSIRRIEHLSMLSKLIFLDLYDNQIEEISGLSSLKLLRVLMLGKNRVHKINNLQELIMLDVLDLHGNKIKKIENVCHLRQLRVLNLAGNELTVVDNLVGLTSLSELNLRRNHIHTLLDIDVLPCIQRLFLSFNDIKSFDDIVCLSRSVSLIELSLDGNPFSKRSDYKQLILQHVVNLRQMDMRRLTEEEKRVACVMARREEEKRKEQERVISIKEKRRIAINNAQRQWKQQLKNRMEESHLPSLIVGNIDCKLSPRRTSPRECFTVDQSALKVVDRVKFLSASHLAELDNDVLNLFGPGSLEALDKEWGEKALTSISTVTFKYISFTDIIPHIYKLGRNFPSLVNLNFDMTNIVSFNELNTLCLLTHLENLQIIPEGNYVTRLSLWKPYVIYCLSHLKLKTLNGDPITNSDISHSNKLFGNLSQMVNMKLPNYRKLMLQANYKNLGVETVEKPSLWLVASTEKTKSEDSERKPFLTNYVNEIVQRCIMADRKQSVLDDVWDKLLLDIVSNSLNEISDIDKYCETSLEKIKRSVKVHDSL